MERNGNHADDSPKKFYIYCRRGTESQVEEFLHGRGIFVGPGRGISWKYSEGKGHLDIAVYTILSASFLPDQAEVIKEDFYFRKEELLEILPEEDAHFDW